MRNTSSYGHPNLFYGLSFTDQIALSFELIFHGEGTKKLELITMMPSLRNNTHFLVCLLVNISERLNHI